MLWRKTNIMKRYTLKKNFNKKEINKIKKELREQKYKEWINIHWMMSNKEEICTVKKEFNKEDIHTKKLG